ncbi:FHA domain-containing protein, partial [Microbacterium arborescens]
PVPAAVAPGAIVAPAAGSAPWTPPPLLEEPAAAAAPPAAPAAPPAPAAAAPAAEPPARPASASSSVVELTLDSGDTIAVSGGGVVLGRAPATGPDDRDVAPVPVVDHTRSISKTHWALLRTDGRVVAVERGSTNGSVLVRGSREQALVPGQPVELRDGDTIRFGDRSAVVAIR